LPSFQLRAKALKLSIHYRSVEVTLSSLDICGSFYGGGALAINCVLKRTGYFYDKALPIRARSFVKLEILIFKRFKAISDSTRLDSLAMEDYKKGILWYSLPPR
jgi:hypothetical protein